MRTNQMFDDDGQLTGVVATIKDITEEAAPQKREVIGESAPMREVMNFVRRVAASEATTILLEGENGTGKDLVAKTLHYQSLRQAEPFIAINCAAIPRPCSKASCSATKRAPSPTPARRSAASSNWPTRARCSWTKSARFR